MDCGKCLEEDKYLKASKGSGYDYIGKENNCQRHSQPDNITLKWTDGKPYERSRRMKHQIDDQELINKADFIIDNNGSIHDLEQSVNFLLSFIPFLPNNKHEE